MPASSARATPERDAWLTSQLVMSVFHHHSFSAEGDPTLAADLWRYCLGGLGGTVEAGGQRSRGTACRRTTNRRQPVRRSPARYVGGK